MIIAGLRFRVDNYKAVQGYIHVVKPEVIIGKSESDNGESAKINALAVQQGTNGTIRIIIFSKIKPPNLVLKI